MKALMLLARFGLQGNCSQLVLAGKTDQADSSRVSPCAHPMKGLKGNVFPDNGIVVWKPRNDAADVRSRHER
jgi:hypothetical protein